MSAGTATDRLPAVLGEPGRLADALNADHRFRRAARFWTVRLALDLDGETLVVRIVDGVVQEVASEGPGADADITISGPREGWARLLAPVPPPFYQDVLAATLHHGFAVSGDFVAFVAYTAAIQRLQQLIREQA